MTPELLAACEEQAALGKGAAQTVPVERLPRKFPAVGTHGFELLDGWLALDALPSELRQRKYVNRSDVFEHAARARAGDLSWTVVLVASYAWGYARTPFGPFRITRILNQNQHIEETLSEVAELLHSNDPLGAYFVLRNPRNAHGIGKIKYLGPAFFTKFLYFARGSDADSQPLILDRVLAQAVRDLCDDPTLLRGASWKTSQYAFYLAFMNTLAKQHRKRPDELERALFVT